MASSAILCREDEETATSNNSAYTAEKFSTCIDKMDSETVFAQLSAVEDLSDFDFGKLKLTGPLASASVTFESARISQKTKSLPLCRPVKSSSPILRVAAIIATIMMLFFFMGSMACGTLVPISQLRNLSR